MTDHTKQLIHAAARGVWEAKEAAEADGDTTTAGELWRLCDLVRATIDPDLRPVRRHTGKNLSRLIRRALKRCQITQADLARRMGTSPQTVSALLAGSRPITDESLCRIAEALVGHDFVRADLVRVIEQAGMQRVGAENRVHVIRSDTPSAFDPAEALEADAVP